MRPSVHIVDGEAVERDRFAWNDSSCFIRFLGEECGFTAMFQPIYLHVGLRGVESMTWFGMVCQVMVQ